MPKTLSYAEWARMQRARTGKTLTEVSKETPINRGLIWGIEKGLVVPIGEQAQRLHALYGCKPEQGETLEAMR